MDRWTQGIVNLSGGLDTSSSPISQGIVSSGSCRVLTNYECLVGGGYRRINGYSKYSTTQVTGSGAILGAFPFKAGVVAVRKDGTSNDIFYGTGTTWTKINAASRPGTVVKARAVTFVDVTSSIVTVDGANHAHLYDGTTATLISHASAPSNPKYVAYHLSRLVLAGYSVSPSSISISAPSDVTDWAAGNGAIELSVGDTVIGLKSFRNELYILGLRSIYKLQGETKDNFVVVPVATNIGLVDGDTLQEVGGDLVYLSRDGFRTVSGTTKVGDVELGIVSRSISKDVRDMIASAVVTYSSITIPDKSQYRLFFHRASDTNTSASGFIGTYKPSDLLTYEWSRIQGFPVYCAGSDVLDNGTTLQVFGHVSDGFIYTMDIGNTLGSDNIFFTYKSPPLTFPQDQIDPRKVVYKWAMVLRLEGSSSLNTNCILDEFEQPKRNQPPAKILDLTSVSAVWDANNWDAFTWAQDDEVTTIRINQEGSGKTFTLEISGSTDQPSHTIFSHILEYTVKGKR